jgi:hypothetical protein
VSNKKAADWDRIERDYRTSKFTLRELATKHGVSHQAIGKRAKVKGWTQDLAAQIRQATNAKVVAKMVDAEVAKGGQAVADTVLAAAEIGAQVILRHQARVGRAVDVSMRMLDELDATTLKTDELDGLFDVMSAEMADKDLNAARQRFNDLMRLHNRIGSAQKLMDALQKAQVLERQAFGLDDKAKNPASDLEGLSDEELDSRLTEALGRIGR